MSRRGYVPDADETAMIDILGMDAAEFIETVDHNIQAPATDKLMQVKVLANNLPGEHLDAFNEYSKRVSLSALDEVVHWLNEHDAGKAEAGDDPRYAVGIGMFQINKLVRSADTPDDGEES
jgi:hypothetical protein